MARLHATCIAQDGLGILLRGPSGAGKSDLALRMIDAGARLVADDQVFVHAVNGVAVARPASTLAGLLEVRGLGIVRLPHLAEAPVGLIADLVGPGEVPRLPEPAVEEIAGIGVPRVALAPFEPSAAAKLRLAARRAKDDIDTTSR
jgi:serine kinase of HPr protein (carbohydrate metabolism regulator)